MILILFLLLSAGVITFVSFLGFRKAQQQTSDFAYYHDARTQGWLFAFITWGTLLFTVLRWSNLI